MNMNITEASLDDAEELGRLHGIVQDLHVKQMPKHFRTVENAKLIENIQNALQNTDTRVLVARDNGHVLGYVIGIVREIPETEFKYRNRMLYLDQIVVDPIFQRKGVGTKLVETLLIEAREKGLDSVVLDSWYFNETAAVFFHSLGFKTLMRRLEIDISNR